MRTWLSLNLRQTARGLRRNPTFTVAVLLTLALAIGANTAVFSVVNGVLLNPLPYPEPESLVDVLTRAPGAPNAPGASGGIPDMPESASMYVTYAENNRTFESLGVYQPFPLTVNTATGSEQIRAVSTSRGVLEALRVQPMLGRAFTSADYHTGPPDTVVLGYGYWQRRFGGGESVIGRRMTIDSRLSEVVGVLPAGFRFPGFDPEIVLTLRLNRARMALSAGGLRGLARLRPGTTLAQANA